MAEEIVVGRAAVGNERLMLVVLGRMLRGQAQVGIEFDNLVDLSNAGNL